MYERLILVVVGGWREGVVCRLVNPFLGDPKINTNSQTLSWKKKADEVVKTADLREEAQAEQQRLLIPESGVSGPDSFQMVKRKWSSRRKSPLKTLSQTHETEGKLGGHGITMWTDDPEGKGCGLQTQSPEPIQLLLLFLKLSAGEGWGK